MGFKGTERVYIVTNRIIKRILCQHPMSVYVQFILYVKDNTYYFLPIKCVRKFSKRETSNINEPDDFTFHKNSFKHFNQRLHSLKDAMFLSCDKIVNI